MMSSQGTPKSVCDDAKKRVVKSSSRRGIRVDDDDDTLDWSCGRYILFNLGDGGGMRVGQFDVQFSAKDKLKVTLCIAVKTGQVRRSNQVSLIPREEIQYGPFNLVGRSLPPEVLRLTQSQQPNRPVTPAMSTSSVTPMVSPSNATPAASSSNVTPVASPRSATPKASSTKQKRNAKPRAQPAAQPSSQPVAQPSSQPAAQPSSQPATQLPSQSAAQPPSQPAVQSSSQPSTQPAAQSSTQPAASRYGGVPSAQPSTQPSAKPAASTRPGVPSAQLSARPLAESSTEPPAQPSVPRTAGVPSAGVPPVRQGNAATVVRVKDELDENARLRPATVQESAQRPANAAKAASHPTAPSNLKMFLPFSSSNGKNAFLHTVMPPNARFVAPPVIGATSSHHGGTIASDNEAIPHTVAPRVSSTGPPMGSSASLHRCNSKEQLAAKLPLTNSKEVAKGSNFKEVAKASSFKEVPKGSNCKEVAKTRPRNESPMSKKPRVVQDGAVAMTGGAVQLEAAPQKIEWPPLRAAVKHVKQVGSRMLAMIPGNPMSPKPTKQGRHAQMDARIIQFTDDEIKRVENASGSSSADEPPRNEGPLYYELNLNFTKRPEDQYEMSSCPSDSDQEIDRSHKYVPTWCKNANETCAKNQQHDWDTDWIFGNNVVDIKEEDISRSVLNRKQRPSVALYNFEKHKRRLISDAKDDDAWKSTRRKLRVFKKGWVLKNPQDL
eukprot:GEMP01003082.1.p1 GENE.GEMP01003082.1~~GEMP01003082.1.p1  ORF type:complete len:769 (+),score=136.83 GEMP01003082.1:149-2308(+)